jgi:mono/diheme cytochrome c family protein
MKKIAIITGVFTAVLLVSSCRMGKNDPGKIYMPDMTYSRAYETYAGLDTTIFTNDPATIGEGKMIFYNNLPVAGTVARGELPAFPLAMDKAGDTANYVAAKQILNPLPALNSTDSLEAARLYLVNCGICHGEKLDGNGPLFNGGNGPYTAAPRNLVGDPVVSKMPEGQIFYSVTYGKNAMGSYASQLSTKQRWMVIHYIKGRQNAANSKTPVADSSATAKK